MQSGNVCFLSFKNSKLTNYMYSYIVQKGENVENDVSNTTYSLSILCSLEGMKKQFIHKQSYSLHFSFLILPPHTYGKTTLTFAL